MVPDLSKLPALPVLWQHDDEDYSYWFGGTCFYVTYFGRHYVLTARHVIGSRPARELLIPQHPEARTGFLISGVHTTTHSGNKYPDYADIVLLHVEEGMIDSRESAVTPLSLSNRVPRAFHSLKQRGVLIVRGYPKSISSIDYDRRHISLKAFVATAEYVGPFSSEHCHTLRFHDTDPIEDMNGMSGSPIVFYDRRFPEPQPQLVGMLIRGSKESRLGHFVSSDVLLEALRKTEGVEYKLSAYPRQIGQISSRKRPEYHR